MVERAWFRLLIRALGVLFVGLGVTGLVDFVYRVIYRISIQPQVRMDLEWVHWVAYGTSHLIQPAIGVYLLFFAEGLIRLCLRDAIGRCGYCQFDVSGVLADVCPECGSPLDPSRHKPASGLAESNHASNERSPPPAGA